MDPGQRQRHHQPRKRRHQAPAGFSAARYSAVLVALAGVTVLAPVMIATASSIVCDLGVITAARPPSRWMWIRSAS